MPVGFRLWGTAFGMCCVWILGRRLDGALDVLNSWFWPRI